MPQHLQVKQVKKCYVLTYRKLPKTSSYLAALLSLNVFYPQLFKYSCRPEQAKAVDLTSLQSIVPAQLYLCKAYFSLAT